MEKGVFEHHSSGQKRKRTSSTVEDRPVESSRGAIVVSVVESRGREVCICKIDTSNTSHLEVFLLLDGHSYNETILELSMLKPDEILLHDGAREKTLFKKIDKRFHRSSRIINISRQYFDQDRGADMLRRIVVGKLDKELMSKYTVLAGSFCLLKYVENCRNSTFASHSLRMNFEKGSTGRMLIDRKTAFHLELVMNCRTGDQKGSLFGVINHTKTAVGARFLRSNILSPLTDRDAILHRQILVEYLLRNPEIYSRLVTLMIKFPDLDKMLNGLTYRAKTMTINTARVGIDTLLYIKQALGNANEIVRLLLYPNHREPHQDETERPIDMNLLPDILQQAVSVFHDSKLTDIHKLIGELLEEDAVFSKSHQEMRFQECFAVSPEIDGLLDAARKLYLQTVEEIYLMAQNMEKALDIPIKVTFSSARGYHYIVPSEMLPLPTLFVQPVQSRRNIHCSTLETISLSDRALEAMEQCIALTNQIVSALVERILEDIDALFRLTDIVALLDLCLCFADVVALSSSAFACPEITTQGSISLKNARHPILIYQQNSHGFQYAENNEENIPPNTKDARFSHVKQNPRDPMNHSFVPNDAWLDDIERFMVITGPNGAGKTIFIKQVALIVVLAQIGCYVPCQSARINIRSSILSRLGTSDDLENNMSTFATEMNDAAYVLDHADKNSLVLIDELGRGTCIVDGLSLALAISESLMTSQAFVLFVTHFPQLTELPNMYAFARNLHMKTNLLLLNEMMNTTDTAVSSSKDTCSRDTSVATSRSVSIEFLHQAVAGASDLNNGYGILMSELCNFPASIVHEARKFRQKLGDLYPLHYDTGVLQQQPQFVLFKLLQKFHQVIDSLPGSYICSNDTVEIGGEAINKLERIMQRISIDEKQAINQLLDQVAVQASNTK